MNITYHNEKATYQKQHNLNSLFQFQNKYGLRRHVKQSTSFQYSALNRKSGDGSDDNTIDYLIKIKPDVVSV